MKLIAGIASALLTVGLVFAPSSATKPSVSGPVPTSTSQGEKPESSSPPLRSEGSFGDPGYVSSPAEEEALRDVAKAANDAQAVGYYRDSATSLRVRVPDSTGLAGNTTNVAGFTLSFLASQFDSRSVEDVEDAATKVAQTQPSNVNFFVYYDPKSDQVTVSGTLDESTKSKLNEMHGVVGLSGSGMQLQARGEDSAPFWGGSVVGNSAYTTRCSTAFAVHGNSGTDYMVTAGHCFSLNTAVYSPYDLDDDFNTDPGHSHIAMGTVTKQTAGTSRDIELISGYTYAGRIYMGNYTGNDYPVSSAMDPTIGASYCVSGITTLQNCGKVIASLTARWCEGVPRPCIDHMAQYSGGTFTQGGDSGGPIVNFGSTSVGVRGFHNGTGYDENNNLFMYGTRWESLLAAYPALSIILG